MKAVVDIGKTHVKLAILTSQNDLIRDFYTSNTPVKGRDYTHADTEAIWSWLLACFQEFDATNQIRKLIFTTHGATAALIDATNHKLVLPILDYEFEGLSVINEEYETLRPSFEESYSPSLPAGLNLGRQLFWLNKHFPSEFNAASHILMYPQYWAWRLTGQLSSECTSLGCHTDLWASHKHDFSSLVKSCQWDEKLPLVTKINQPIGNITPQIAAQSGLDTRCQVYPGIHDSNASYLRYLSYQQAETASFTVISTGTWTILMQTGGKLLQLNENKDMLANVDINGDPVCCARFMGGREYETICTTLGGAVDNQVSQTDIQKVVDQQWMVTPDFSQGNGPYGGLSPKILVPSDAGCAEAIATVYCALMIDQRLDDLNAQGPIYIEGAFLKNHQLCALVAQLRADQEVFLSTDSTGTVLGAAHLMQDDAETPTSISLSMKKCHSNHIKGIFEYKKTWHNQLLS